MYCVERGKVSAGSKAACGTCHYLLVKQLTKQAYCASLARRLLSLVEKNRERELGLDRRETG